MCQDNTCLNLVGGKLFWLPGLVGWMGFPVRKKSGMICPYFPKKPSNS